MDWLLDWFTPPTAARWYGALAGGLLTLLLLALVVAYWPRQLNGPLTSGERHVAKGPLWRRWWLPISIVFGVASMLVGSLVFLVFGPRPPSTLQYETGAHSLTDDKCPPAHAHRRRLDAVPLIRSVLARARQAGAGQWQTPDDEYRQQLRQWCMEALIGRESPATPAPTPGDGERLPAWVCGSVEMTIIHGLMQAENVRWVGLHCPGTPPWQRLQGLLSNERTQVDMFPNAGTATVQVLALFNGARTTTGDVSFSALIEGSPGASADLTFLIFAAGGKTPLQTIRQTVTLVQPRQVVSVTGKLPGAAPALLLAHSDDGVAQAPLTARDAPPITVAVQGPQAQPLISALQRSLGVNGLADRLGEHGFAKLEFAARAPAVQEVALVIRGGEMLVLAPGTDPNTVPVGTGGVVSVPETSYARRVSYVGEAFPGDLSWMSVALRARPTDAVPISTADERWHTGGYLMNQKLHEGRLLDTTKPTAAVPMVELGPGGAYVRFRFSPDQQGLSADLVKLSEAWEPTRAQAFTASVAWAVDWVLHQESPTRGTEAEPTTLLTQADQDILTEQGRRNSDAIALIVISLCLLSLLIQARWWARSK